MGSGGKRIGAGRPVGTGKYGEPTKAVRVPLSLLTEVYALLRNKGVASCINDDYGKPNEKRHSTSHDDCLDCGPRRGYRNGR